MDQVIRLELKTYDQHGICQVKKPEFMKDMNHVTGFLFCAGQEQYKRLCDYCEYLPKPNFVNEMVSYELGLDQAYGSWFFTHKTIQDYICIHAEKIVTCGKEIIYVILVRQKTKFDM